MDDKENVVLVLEAMKMENVLKLLGEGIVASVEVNVGNTVEKNQVLLEIEWKLCRIYFYLSILD